MSRGFLIHAYNNTEIDYGTMALCSSLLIKKNLRYNQVALITNQGTIDWARNQHGKLFDRAFDHVVIVDHETKTGNRTFFDTRNHNKVLPYRNGNRVDSYELSPFDETILLDADYLVLDTSLDHCWSTADEIMINRHVIDLDHRLSPPGFDARLNKMGIPLYWATLLYFRKGKTSKCLFDTMRFIKENFAYYQNLYQFSPGGFFRNDYALSIAIHMLHGQFENDPIAQFPMNNIMVATEHDDLIGFVNGNAYFLNQTKPDRDTIHKVMTNIHVMNKWSITRMANRIIAHAIN